MIRNLLFVAAVCLSTGAGAQAPSYNEHVQQYVSQYKEFAEIEQQRLGVPAAITLGQGILETQAGQSELATVANNHFGIKCRKEWTGETFAHDDDAPQECFRKYPNALHSYQDHSDYLRSGTRYSSCFACSPTDYAAWAKELRKCGYATNPNYANQLIKIIEDFHLQEYTYAALDHKAPILIASAASPAASAAMADKAEDALPGHDTPSAPAAERVVYGKLVHRDGVKGFYAHKGDVLLEYAIQYKVRYAKLLEINGLPDAPLGSDMFVSLEKGGRVTQILSRDASDTPAPSNLSAAVAPPAKTESPVVDPRELAAPVAAMEPAAAPATETPEPKQEQPLREVAPVVQQTIEKPENAPAVATPAQQVVTPAQQAVVAKASEDAPVAAPAPKTQAPAGKPVNIANEVAVEEMKPATKEEEPKDGFSRMKARFDRVVYAPPAAKTAEPRPVAIAEPVAKEPIVKEPAAAPRQLSADASGQKEFHVVGKGETVFGIAKKYDISMKQLMDMNQLNFEAIRVGQKLRVK